MSSKQTDVQKLMLQTQRVARLIWRHTPPLRSAIERDDWLQEAAAEILSRQGEENGDCGVSRQGAEPTTLHLQRGGVAVVRRQPSRLDNSESHIVDMPLCENGDCGVSRLNNSDSHIVDMPLSPFSPQDAGEKEMTRSLRALAMRIIRKHDRQPQTVNIDTEDFDKFEAREPEPIAHRHRIPLIPLLRKRKGEGAHVMSKKNLLTLSALVHLHHSKYKRKAIAQKFGVSQRHIRRLFALWKRRPIHTHRLPRRAEHPCP